MVKYLTIINIFKLFLKLLVPYIILVLSVQKFVFIFKGFYEEFLIIV